MVKSHTLIGVHTTPGSLSCWYEKVSDFGIVSTMATMSRISSHQPYQLLLVPVTFLFVCLSQSLPPVNAKKKRRLIAIAAYCYVKMSWKVIGTLRCDDGDGNENFTSEKGIVL